MSKIVAPKYILSSVIFGLMAAALNLYIQIPITSSVRPKVNYLVLILVFIFAFAAFNIARHVIADLHKIVKKEKVSNNYISIYIIAIVSVIVSIPIDIYFVQRDWSNPDLNIYLGQFWGWLVIVFPTILVAYLIIRFFRKAVSK